MKKERGRPDILTQEKHDMCVAAFYNGASYQMAADCVGISERCIYVWKSKGERDIKDGKETKYVHFLQDIKKARYEYEMSCCQEIQRQGEGGAWQALSWLLERRNPKSFARNSEELRQTAEIQEQLEALTSIVEEKLNKNMCDDVKSEVKE